MTANFQGVCSESQGKEELKKMTRKKRTGYYQRGQNWRIDTSYKGIRIRERVATEEMAKIVLRKAKTLIDENRYLELRRES